MKSFRLSASGLVAVFPGLTDSTVEKRPTTMKAFSLCNRVGLMHKAINIQHYDDK
jgi:hypothetical protein